MYESAPYHRRLPSYSCRQCGQYLTCTKGRRNASARRLLLRICPIELACNQMTRFPWNAGTIQGKSHPQTLKLISKINFKKLQCECQKHKRWLQTSPSAVKTQEYPRLIKLILGNVVEHEKVVKSPTVFYHTCGFFMLIISNVIEKQEISIRVIILVLYMLIVSSDGGNFSHK